MSAEIQPELVLCAKSIVPMSDTYRGFIATFVMFEPDADTVTRLRNTESGQRFDGLVLKDTLDGGKENVTIDNRVHTFLSTTPDGVNREHTQILIFQLDQL